MCTFSFPLAAERKWPAAVSSAGKHSACVGSLWSVNVQLMGVFVLVVITLKSPDMFLLDLTLCDVTVHFDPIRVVVFLITAVKTLEKMLTSERLCNILSLGPSPHLAAEGCICRHILRDLNIWFRATNTDDAEDFT